MTTFDNPEWPWDREGIVQSTFDSAALQGGAVLLPSDLVRHLFVLASSRNGGLTGRLRSAEDYRDVTLMVSCGSGSMMLSWSTAKSYDLPPKIFGPGIGLSLRTEPDLEWMVAEIDYELSSGLGMLLDGELGVLESLQGSGGSTRGDRSLWVQFAEASSRARTLAFTSMIEEHGREAFDEDLAEHFNLEMEELAELDDGEICAWLNKSIAAMKKRLAARDPARIAGLAAHYSGAEGELLEWSPTDALVSFAWVEAQPRVVLDQTIACSPEWVRELASITGGSGLRG